MLRIAVEGDAPLRSWGRALALGLLVFASVALIRDTAYQGQDFSVFWKSARNLLEGRSLYDLGRDGAMVFKYPPWVAPLFIPLALLPLSVAKWVWGVMQILMLAYCVRWTRVRVLETTWIWSVLVGFWGIWAVHAMDGQISLLILAGTLWAKERETWVSRLIALLLLSTKIFTLFALFGWLIPDWRRSGRQAIWKWTGTAALGALVFFALSLPANRFQPEGRGGYSLLSSWSEAAGSGGAQFEDQKVRGRDNQGFPALLLRLTHVRADEAQWDLKCFLIFATVALAVLLGVEKYFGPDQVFAIGLGLTAIVHPLAWFHLFVFTYPLVVLALDGVAASRRTWALGVAICGAVAVSVLTRGVLGGAGVTLELLSIKSWGVVVLISTWTFSRRFKDASPV